MRVVFCLFIVVAALATCTFAQPATVILSSNAVLTQECVGGHASPGGTPLSDGTVAYIFWDANANGPDSADALVPIGEAAGFLPNNMFVTSSDGTFYIQLIFYRLPTASRFYIRIPVAATTYVSEVFVVPAGQSSIELTDWTCSPDAPACSPEQIVFDGYVPTIQRQCAILCQALTTRILVAGDQGLAETRVPIVTVTPTPEGCGCPNCFADPSALYRPSDWLWHPDSAIFTSTVQGSANYRCVCMTMYGMLPAEPTTLHTAPGLGFVYLGWAAAAIDTHLHFFQIDRTVGEGDSVPVLIATIPALPDEPNHFYSFDDYGAQPGINTYTLYAVAFNGLRVGLAAANGEPEVIEAVGERVPQRFALAGCYPNPFNAATRISFDLPIASSARLSVLDILGRPVSTLINGPMTAGHHEIGFDAGGLPSGIYFARLQTGRQAVTRKMLLLK